MNYWITFSWRNRFKRFLSNFFYIQIGPNFFWIALFMLPSLSRYNFWWSKTDWKRINLTSPDVHNLGHLHQIQYNPAKAYFKIVLIKNSACFEAGLGSLGQWTGTWQWNLQLLLSTKVRARGASLLSYRNTNTLSLRSIKESTNRLKINSYQTENTMDSNGAKAPW